MRGDRNFLVVIKIMSFFFTIYINIIYSIRSELELINAIISSVRNVTKFVQKYLRLKSQSNICKNKYSELIHSMDIRWMLLVDVVDENIYK